MRTIARIALLATLLPTIAAAETQPDDNVLIALERRNADREAAFDASAAKRANEQAQQEAAIATETHEHAREDQIAASRYRESQVRAAKHATRKTGLLLMAIGAGLGAAGALVWQDAQATQQQIQQGGFATANDITSAGTRVKYEQGTAYGLGGVGAVLLATGLRFEW